MTRHTQLKRSISLPFLILYGLSTIIGAGVFVLIGKVAGVAGLYAPIAFLTASIIAGFTALSYAELSARFPHSAGEAIYLEEAFHVPLFSKVIGIVITGIGILSSATIINGAAGYIQVFANIPDSALIIIIVAALSFLALRGIEASVTVAAMTTCITIAALIFVAAINIDHLATLPSQIDTLTPPPDTVVWIAILSGAFLAFYAFLGFEDMVNIAEEVKNPQRNMPLAVILTLLIATLLYVLIAFTAVLTLTPDELSSSDAPFVALVGKSNNTHLFVAFISAIAVIDGALVQLIKSSRVLYGMSKQQLLHPVFAHVHATRKTPETATLTVAGLILLSALTLPLITLAHATSFITLSLFALVNIALFKLKISSELKQTPAINLPAWLPLIGCILCLVFLAIQII